MTASTPADAHLGIDLGTSSVKAVLLSPQGTQIAQAEAPYAVSHKRSGWAESAPDGLVERHSDRGPRGGGRAPQVRLASIGLSGQMHGVVPTRSDGSPVRNGILWADARAQDQLDTYRCLPPETRRRLANPAEPGHGGTHPRVARPPRERGGGRDALGPAAEGLASAPAHR